MESSLELFALESYKALIVDNIDGNIAYSPFSAFSCMLLGGLMSDGNTSKQIRQALGKISDRLSQEQVASKLFEMCQYFVENGCISISNRAWTNQKLNIPHHFFRIVEEFLHCDVIETSFPEPACSIINQHVNEATHGLIPSIFTPDQLPHDMLCVLTNVIYFKDKWFSSFDEEWTLDGKWYGPVEKMHPLMSTSGKFNYTETRQYQALSLPYKMKNLEMLIVLPKSKDLSAMNSIIKSMKTTQEICKSMKKERVIVKLPRFSVEWGPNSLKELFISLGIKDIFDSSKSTFLTHIPIDQIMQKVVIKVDEKGTEAACITYSTTKCAMSFFQPKEYQFFADHPFMYFIRDSSNGIVLFSGVIVDP